VIERCGVDTIGEVVLKVSNAALDESVISVEYIA
jgi:hypothetical protein